MQIPIRSAAAADNLPAVRAIPMPTEALAELLAEWAASYRALARELEFISEGLAEATNA